jgi:hypothetical protein
MFKSRRNVILLASDYFSAFPASDNNNSLRVFFALTVLEHFI